jgi:outer membrane lipoprotein SlyB
MRKFLALFLGVIFSLGFLSCSTLYNNTSETSLSEVGKLENYDEAVVLSVRPIKIRDTGVGTAIGATLGGILGSFVGEGKAKTLATAVGILGGAFIGYAAGKGNAQELTVKMLTGPYAGQTKVIVVKGTEFKPGDRIRIIYQRDGRIRVSKI